MTSTIIVSKTDLTCVGFFLLLLLFERGCQAEMCCVIVQQREPPSVAGCALEIPLGTGISDLLLHSVMPYIAWFNYGPFHTLKYGI